MLSSCGPRPPLAAFQRMQARNAVVALQPLVQRKGNPGQHASPQRALRRCLGPVPVGFVHSHCHPPVRRRRPPRSSLALGARAIHPVGGIRGVRRLLIAAARLPRLGVGAKQAFPDLWPSILADTAVARATRRDARGSSSISRHMAAAIASASFGGTSNADSPSATRYGTPPTFVLTIGTPLAIASSSEIGMLSTSDGLTATDADR